MLRCTTELAPCIKATCMPSGDRGVKAEYTGETGYIAYTRMAEHECGIKERKYQECLRQTPGMHHPDEERNPGVVQV